MAPYRPYHSNANELTTLSITPGAAKTLPTIPHFGSRTRQGQPLGRDSMTNEDWAIGQWGGLNVLGEGSGG